MHAWWRHSSLVRLSKSQAAGRGRLVGRPGFEPGSAGSEPAVLTLDDPPKGSVRVHASFDQSYKALVFDDTLDTGGSRQGVTLPACAVRTGA